ncbi:MAG: hypothetical protein AAFZ65_02830 [Planctomycetota bacterium]
MRTRQLACLSLGLLAACGSTEPLPIAPRPEHPLNGLTSHVELEQALAGYPVVEKLSPGAAGNALVVAGPEGTTVTVDRGYTKSVFMELPYCDVTVAFPDRVVQVTDRGSGNGSLVVDGQRFAGWTFLLTAEDGLATLPFRDPTVDGWAQLGVELGAEPLEALAVPPREWEDSLR